jgi:hypothetical protein
MALADEGPLPHPARAEVCRHLECDADGQPGGLRLRQEPGEFFRFSKACGDGDDDGEQQNAGDETGLGAQFQIIPALSPRCFGSAPDCRDPAT